MFIPPYFDLEFNDNFFFMKYVLNINLKPKKIRDCPRTFWTALVNWKNVHLSKIFFPRTTICDITLKAS